MGTCANEVMEWVKRNTLRWFGHNEKMKIEGFIKRVYMSKIKGMSRRGKPLER